MKTLNNRLNKAEEVMQKKYGNAIANLANKKSLDAFKKAPQWVLEVYAFFFSFVGSAYLFAQENHLGIFRQDFDKSVFYKTYSFLPQRVEEILWEYATGQEITQEEVRRVFLKVIEKSPKLAEGLREKFLNIATDTSTNENVKKRILGE